MHKSRRALGYAAARRNNTRLVSAAEAYFGTWGNALHAAGMDPNLYFRRKSHKRKMTAKRDHTRYGDVLNPSVSALRVILESFCASRRRNIPVRAINGHCLKCGYGLLGLLLEGSGVD